MLLKGAVKCQHSIDGKSEVLGLKDGKQCSTLTFLNTRQWASKHSKSLAHKDMPLVQNKARKNTPTKARELGTINLLVSCLSPDTLLFVQLHFKKL